MSSSIVFLPRSHGVRRFSAGRIAWRHAVRSVRSQAGSEPFRTPPLHGAKLLVMRPPSRTAITSAIAASRRICVAITSERPSAFSAGGSSHRARWRDRDLRSARRAATAACRAGTAGQAPAGATGRRKGPCRLRQVVCRGPAAGLDIGKQAGGGSAVRSSSSVASGFGQMQIAAQRVLEEFRALGQQRCRRGETRSRLPVIRRQAERAASTFRRRCTNQASRSPVVQAQRDILASSQVRRSYSAQTPSNCSCKRPDPGRRFRHRFASRRKARRDAPCRQQRPAEFQGAAAQRAEGLDGGEGDQDAKRCDRRV
jgi:hypothetical protein